MFGMVRFYGYSQNRGTPNLPASSHVSKKHLQGAVRKGGLGKYFRSKMLNRPSREQPHNRTASRRFGSCGSSTLGFEGFRV